jgi:hypothetical protein
MSPYKWREPEVEEKIRNEIAEAERKRKLFLKTPRLTTEHLKDIDHFRNDPKYGGAHSRSDLAESQVRARIASQALSYLGSPARQRDYVERTVQKAMKYRPMARWKDRGCIGIRYLYSDSNAKV